MASKPATAGPTLTDEQRAALSARRVSVALSAGAGCGKTFVLTERFVGALVPAEDAPPTALGQIVAITFTDRAAREMRDRIRRACHERLLRCPAAEADYWLALLRELDAARISTIHSFCGSLLRRHAVEAGLDPRFDVLDAAQADTLLFEAIDAELRHLLAEGREETIELLVSQGLAGLQAMVETLLGRRSDIDWPAWQTTTPEQLVDRWEACWRGETLPAALRRFAQSPVAVQVLDVARRRPCGQAAMQARFDVIAARLPGLPLSPQPAEDLAAIVEAARVQGSSAKQWDSADDYERFKTAAATLRDEAKKLDRLLKFDRAAALPAARDALGVLAIAAQVKDAYESRKNDLGVLDFDDLLIRARELLVGPRRASLRRRLAGQVRLLLVDEFQDTDPVQVELVRALCDDDLLGGKLFFVGDLKQSIYRFRGAQPQVFRALREEMRPEGRLPLTLNFRSQPGVIDFVNALFATSMGPGYEPLRAYRPQAAPRPSVEFLWATAGPDESDEEDEKASAGPRRRQSGDAERLRRLEADWIARRIRQMLDDRETLVGEAKSDPSPPRPVKPGDVAILFRALTDVAFYEEALRRYGIEYYLVGGKAFYSQQEVYDLVNLLRAIDNPADDLCLLGVLRSPVFGLLDETIFWLKHDRASLNEGLFAEPPPHLDERQRRRVAHAAETLRELREMKDRLPVAQLIREALARTGYDAVLLGEFLGERKLANLYKLLDQARSFDQSGIFTLDDFITRLSEFVARQPDEALSATHPEKADVARLMTIHQSKGLEFPVVFLADVARPKQPSRGTIRFTPQLGPMIRGEEGALTGFDLHAHAESEEDEAELVRLFYVAATRAADYLVLSAGANDVGKPSGPWMQLLAERFDLATGTLLAGDPAEGPLARATLVAPPLPQPAARLQGGGRQRDLAKLADQIERASQAARPHLPPRVGPIPPDATARQQLSFSRLTGQLVAASAPPAVSVGAVDAEEPPGIDPRGLGTLVHAVLAEIDFAAPTGLDELVRRHAAAHLPNLGDQLDEPIALVQRFLASPRAAELAAAVTLHRELEFLLAWPPEGEHPSDGRPRKYLQGFIDCLYQDAAGAWRIVDYKTNRVTAETLGATAAGYEMQMLLYALSAEKVLGQPPAELVLCFLRAGLEHRFAWNAGARERLIELVSRAVAEPADASG